MQASFTIKAMICGYHIYRDIRSVIMNEVAVRVFAQFVCSKYAKICNIRKFPAVWHISAWSFHHYYMYTVHLQFWICIFKHANLIHISTVHRNLSLYPSKLALFNMPSHVLEKKALNWLVFVHVLPYKSILNPTWKKTLNRKQYLFWNVVLSWVGLSWGYFCTCKLHVLVCQTCARSTVVIVLALHVATTSTWSYTASKSTHNNQITVHITITYTIKKC